MTAGSDNPATRWINFAKGTYAYVHTTREAGTSMIVVTFARYSRRNYHEEEITTIMKAGMSGCSGKGPFRAGVQCDCSGLCG